jgi:hypothetical protein
MRSIQLLTALLLLVARSVQLWTDTISAEGYTSAQSVVSSPRPATPSDLTVENVAGLLSKPVPRSHAPPRIMLIPRHSFEWTGEEV